MNLTKNVLRKNAKEIRGNIDVSDCSQKICEHILSWDLYKNAHTVMIFSPIRSEISLMKLLNCDSKSKSFLFPSVCGNEIYPVFYNKSKGFKNGDFNIKEPIGDILSDYSLIDIVFVPALACDSRGFRLGYGKGFYDKFIPHLSDKCIKVVPISSELIFEQIPAEAHDMPVDYIVTENGFIHVSSKANSSSSNY